MTDRELFDQCAFECSDVDDEGDQEHCMSLCMEDSLHKEFDPPDFYEIPHV